MGTCTDIGRSSDRVLKLKKFQSHMENESPLSSYARCWLEAEICVAPYIYGMYFYALVFAMVFHFTNECVWTQVLLLILPIMHYGIAFDVVILQCFVNNNFKKGLQATVKRRYNVKSSAFWLILFISDVLVAPVSLFAGIALAFTTCDTERFDMLYYLAVATTFTTTLVCVTRAFMTKAEAEEQPDQTQQQAALFNDKSDVNLNF